MTPMRHVFLAIGISVTSVFAIAQPPVEPTALDLELDAWRAVDGPVTAADFREMCHVPDLENAAVIHKTCADEVDAIWGDLVDHYYDYDIEAIAETLRGHEDLLDRLHRAAAKERCDWGTTFDYVQPGGWEGYVRDAIRILCADALVHADAGDDTAAFDRICDAIRVSRHASADPFHTGWMTTWASIDAVADRVRIMGLPLTAEQWQTLADLIRAWDVAHHVRMSFLAQGGGVLLDAFRSPEETDAWIASTREQIDAWIEASPIEDSFKEGVRADHEKRSRYLLRVREITLPQRGEQIDPAIERELIAHLQFFRQLSDEIDGDYVDWVDRIDSTLPKPTVLWQKNVDGMIKLCGYAQARLATIIFAFETLASEAEHGRLPNQTTYETPRDPRTGGRLIYRRHGRGFKVIAIEAGYGGESYEFVWRGR